jgi:hypothetical protein
MIATNIIQIGIIVGLLSTSIQSLGLTLQRKSHLLEDDKDDHDARRPPYKRRRWQLGMGMFVISNLVGSTIQITTLPLPVLSTLQASGLVFNTAFATLLLKEPFTHFSLIGTVLTCAGAALIATFGAIGEPAHGLNQLLDLLYKRQFIVWMIATLVVAVGTIVFAHVLKVYSSHKHFEQQVAKQERSTSGSAHHVPDQTHIKRSFTASLPPQLQLKHGRLKLIRGLAYALISGILSAHSLLVAKSAVELLVRTIVDHNNQFNRFQSWLILLALLFFALTQLYYLHLGLRLCSTSVLYPFVFCIYNIIAILDGLIYFRQASRLSALHGGLIAVGTVILLSGVLALSWRLDDTTPSDPMGSQSLPPQTPLTPGMGLVSTTTEECERSPLLPTSRRRGSSSASRASLDEQTPLLHRRQRPRDHSLLPEPNTQDMWAEINDVDGEEDILASLPRTPSPFLTHRNITGRRRAGSAPIKRKRDSTSSADSQFVRFEFPPPRRRGTSGPRNASGGMDERRSSAPTKLPVASGSESAEPSKSTENGTEALPVDGERPRSTSAQARPSRWDMGVHWLRSAKKEARKEWDGQDDPGG